MTAPETKDVRCGTCGRGIACRDCQDEPHDCEECIACVGGFAREEVPA